MPPPSDAADESDDAEPDDAEPDGFGLRWSGPGPLPACPVCRTPRARLIVWGMPVPAVFEDPDVVLGGCVVVEGRPSHECRDPACRARF
jgi:hypothetical protein